MIRIKKYPNRRLYNTETSSYLNLQELGELVKSGHKVQVVDSKTGADLTTSVLLQVLVELQGGADLLPSGLLHRMIRTTRSHPMQAAAMQQLSAGLGMLDQQLETFERQFGWMNPGAPPPAAKAEPEVDEAEPEPEAPAEDPELKALRDRLAALEQRLKS